MLSLLSALVVASTAFVGVSIYAQTDDSGLTTFEEEALAAGEQFEDTTSNATSDDNAAEDGSTSTADVSFLEGLVICDVGTAEISGGTEVASFDESTTPTVSVTVMSETEVAGLSNNETETASADSARCIMTDGGESDNATGTAEATPDASSNATSMNATGSDNATSTSSTETNMTSMQGSDEQILVVQGQDFASGQVVLMFTENALVGIDDVDENGEIEAKIPMPSGETEVAGSGSGTELRFLESGTQRTATFEFDGQTLTAAAGGDIEAEGGETTMTPAPSNSTSTNSTSSSNSTNSTMQ